MRNRSVGTPWLAIALVAGTIAILPGQLARAETLGAPVQLNNQVLFQLAGSPELSAEERSALVQERINRWATNPNRPALKVVAGRRGATLMLGDDTLVVVNAQDAQLNGGEVAEVAERWSKTLGDAVAPKPEAPAAPAAPPLAPLALARRLGSILGLLVSGAIAAWLILWGTARVAVDPRRHGLRLPPALVSLVGLTIATLLAAGSVSAALTRFPDPPSLALVAPLIALGSIALILSAEMLGNLAGGLAILFNSLYKIGDRVRLGGHAGTVTRIGLFFTRLETERFGVRLVPNGAVLRRGVALTPRAPLARLRLPMRLAYTVDRELAQALILEAALRAEGIVDDPVPEALIAALEEECIRYELTACVKEGERPGIVASRFHVHLMDVLGENDMDPSGASLSRPRLRIGMAPADPHRLS